MRTQVWPANAAVITVASPELSKLLSLLEYVLYDGLKQHVFASASPWYWLKVHLTHRLTFSSFLLIFTSPFPHILFTQGIE